MSEIIIIYLLQAKQEELSEMQIRRELGEKKLSTTARDAELRAEQLQRRLDDAHNQLKRLALNYLTSSAHRRYPKLLYNINHCGTT